MPTFQGTLSRNGRKVQADPIRIRWDAGDHTAKLDADVPVSTNAAFSPSSWTRTITSYSTDTTGAEDPGGLTPVRRLRVTPPSDGVTQRFWMPITGAYSADSEIRSLWYGHANFTGLNRGQFGHVHRFQLNPANSRPWGYIVWNDTSLATDPYINLDTWYTDALTHPHGMTQGVTATPPSGAGGRLLPGLQRWVSILSCSKVGTTITLNLPYGHKVIVGDTADVETELSNGYQGAVYMSERLTFTAVTANSATATSTTSATYPIYIGGAGQMKMLSSNMPYWVCSRLEGVTLRAKIWPYGVGEPSWEDHRYAVSYTDAGGGVNGPVAGVVGQGCIYAGHLDIAATSFVEYGEVNWQTLD